MNRLLRLRGNADQSISRVRGRDLSIRGALLAAAMHALGTAGALSSAHAESARPSPPVARPNAHAEDRQADNAFPSAGRITAGVGASGSFVFVAPTYVLATPAAREPRAALGFTYNFENPATDYRNGVSSHLDWAASQFFSETSHVGLAGYDAKNRPEGWNAWLTLAIPLTVKE